MEEKLNALCVRTVDYKDNDRLITLCTAEKGKILVKATGCKAPKAKLKFAASPLCFGEYIVVEAKGRYTLKGCDPYETFTDLALDIKRYYAGFSILEWLDKLSNEDETETCRNLMILGTSALKNLTFGEELPEKNLTEFLFSTLQALGYGLNFDKCAVSGKSLNGRMCYDFTAGGIVSFENRSMDYIEFSKDDVGVLTENAPADVKTYVKLMLNLESILGNASGLKRNYSLKEFLKY